jgi:hypothetical protein
MLAELREADAACRRAQAELFEGDAMIAGRSQERSAVACWHARRAELLRSAAQQAERVAALYTALYGRSGAPGGPGAYTGT